MPEQWEFLDNMLGGDPLRGNIQLTDLTNHAAGLPFLLHDMEGPLSDLLGFVREIQSESEEAKILESIAGSVLRWFEDEETRLRLKWEHTGKEWDEWRYITNIYCNIYKNAIATGIRLKQNGSKLEPLIWLTLFFREWIRLPFEEELWRLHRQWLIENFAFDLSSPLRKIERIFEDEILVQRLKAITKRMIELAQGAFTTAARPIKKDIPRKKAKRRGGCSGGGPGGSGGGGEETETVKEITPLEVKTGDLIPISKKSGEIAIPGKGETEKIPDKVDCSVFSPYTVPKGETLLINVFVHLSKQLSQAENMAKRIDPDTEGRETTTLYTLIKNNSELAVRLVILELDNMDLKKTITWQGIPQHVSFYATIPDTISNESLTGIVTVSQDDVTIGEIMFKVIVISKSLARATGRLSKYQKLFLSYASEDRHDVRICAQMLKMLGKNIFWDILSLEPGDFFESKLYSFIDECEAVLLFWSSNAKKSEWVAKEWSYTIKKKGIDRLIPFILEGPPPVPPPPELSEMNMNDALVYIK